MRDTTVAPGDFAFIAGVERDLSLVGQALALASAPAGPSEADTYRKLASERRVDGVILTDLRAADQRLALVVHGPAAVTIGRPDIDSPFPAVPVDAVSGVEAMVDHLVGLGHRALAHVGGSPALLHERRRRQAFEHACMRESRAGSSTPTSARARVGRRRRSSSPIPRLTGPRSRTRTIGWRWPASASCRPGLSIPRDLSIAAFDESDIARYAYPSLTAVVTDAEEWVLAARTLLAAIAGIELADTQLAPARLVVRELDCRGTGATVAP